MFKSKKVIVSGATGFIGQHLIPILLKDGYEVLAISRNQKRAEFLPWFKDVKFISYDFHSDLQITETEVEEGKKDKEDKMEEEALEEDTSNEVNAESDGKDYNINSLFHLIQH